MKRKLTIELNKKQKLLEKYGLEVAVSTEKPMVFNLHFRWLPKSKLHTDFNEEEEKFLIKNTSKYIEQNLLIFLRAYLNTKINN